MMPIISAVLAQGDRRAPFCESRSAPYSKSGDLVVEAVIAGCGLSLAMDALLLSMTLKSVSSNGCRWVARSRVSLPSDRWSDHRPWLAIRRQLSRATDSEYEQAKSFAQARREKALSPGLRLPRRALVE
jgi:hypothetical protein